MASTPKSYLLPNDPFWRSVHVHGPFDPAWSASHRRDCHDVFASLLTYLQHVRYPAHLGPEIHVANTGIGVIQAPEPEPRIMRYELTDFEWTAIRPFLPNKPRGVPRVNDRRVLNGIFWILRSGAPWRDLPEGFGPYTTCYNRFVRWRMAGIWDLIMEALVEAHDGSVQMIDTSTVRVHQHGGCAGGGETKTDGPVERWVNDQNTCLRRY